MTHHMRTGTAPDPSPPAPPGALRRLTDGLVALGPFAAALVAYKALLDYALPEDWFSLSVLRYLFAGLCALCLGFALRMATQWRRDLPAEEETSAPLLPPAEVSVRRLVDDSAHSVLAEFRVLSHRGLDLAGWSQYLDDHHVPPTAIGTSYGLRMLAACDLREPRVRRRHVFDSLLALQKTGGGWAASTQRDRGRPEVTAWVLAAMVRSGLDEVTRARLTGVLEDMLDPAEDPLGMDRITVLTIVVAALAEIAPESSGLLRLVHRLADAARPGTATGGGTACWGESVHATEPSAAHTARAVLALHRAAAALPDGSPFTRVAGAGLRWLCGTDLELRLTDEQVRRPMADGTVDALLVGHFTPAWVTRALLLPGAPEAPELLAATARSTLDCFKDGTWRWHDGRQPIWLAYQGALAMREYALRATPCP
ncbi:MULTISPECIES: prenyltransferase/squalene oxidase repeat-containing protein [unclassified Streptomyces]|uniref:hypothetical protein n=1 Tax=Streptomyces sp. SYP-A7185 TaxID=3040076 RepID=UPI0038F65982